MGAFTPQSSSLQSLASSNPSLSLASSQTRASSHLSPSPVSSHTLTGRASASPGSPVTHKPRALVLPRPSTHTLTDRLARAPQPFLGLQSHTDCLAPQPFPALLAPKPSHMGLAPQPFQALLAPLPFPALLAPLPSHTGLAPLPFQAPQSHTDYFAPQTPKPSLTLGGPQAPPQLASRSSSPPVRLPALAGARRWRPTIIGSDVSSFAYSHQAANGRKRAFGSSWVSPLPLPPSPSGQ